MITSIQNNKVKQWNKLKRKKERTKTQTFLIEGFHLVEEANKSDWKLLELIVQEGVDLPRDLEHFAVTVVTSAVFKHITDTPSPQGIAGIIQMAKPDWQPFQRILVLDAVQDPGNLGTMIRTADAAGFDAVFLGEGSVDLYNDKTIRSTQGSLFHIPIFQVELNALMPELKQAGFAVWAATLKQAELYQTITPTEKVALVIGNEGSGISDAVLRFADHCVKIPIYGRAESLNASVAGGILMYHLSTTNR